MDRLVLPRCENRGRRFCGFPVDLQTGEVDVLNFVLPDGVLFAFFRVESPHEDGGVESRRYEAGVIWKPGDRPDWASVSLERVLRWAGGCEEIVNVDEVYKHAGKKMAAVREHDFTTLLDLNVFVLKDFSLEDIHHADAIEEANDDLESGWVERH